MVKYNNNFNSAKFFYPNHPVRYDIHSLSQPTKTNVGMEIK